MKSAALAACILVCLGLCAPVSKAQTTVTYYLNDGWESGPADLTSSNNFLYNNGPTDNFCVNLVYWYDQRGSTNDSARPLIQFPLPTLPPCAVVTQVQLQLFFAQYTFIDVNNNNAIVPWPFSLYQMLVPWDPCNSNWTQSSTSTNWNTPGLGAGTDYNATPAATTTIASATQPWNNAGVRYSWDITALYLQWANGTAPNYGLHLRGQPGVPNETTSQGDTTDGVAVIDGPTYEDNKFCPWLVITYTLPAGTCGGCCYPNGTCQVQGSTDCANAGGTAQASGSTCSPNTCPVASGTCCRGSTCVTGVAASACTGSDTLYISGGATCNATGNHKTPCCEADFNHVGGVTVQDIFDFLSAWFAKNPIANITSNGSGAPTVQSIFDFLSAWFSKC